MFGVVKDLMHKRAANRKEAVIEGPCEVDNVYVYNGYPLCDVENGETFFSVMDLFRKHGNKR